MDRDNMRFGEYIRFQRLRREITLREMSEALGISLSMLSDIEQMRKKPFNTQAIDRFCSYLGLSEDERIRMLEKTAESLLRQIRADRQSRRLIPTQIRTEKTGEKRKKLPMNQASV